MFWSKNKQEKSEDVDKLAIRVKELELITDDLEQKFRSLRGLVNKKLYPDEEEKPEKVKKDDTPQDLNSLAPKFL